MTQYAFIGAGNMAGAIIKGMTVGTGAFEGKNIHIFDPNPVVVNALKETCGVVAEDSMEAAIAAADIIVLAVKPHILTRLYPQLKAALGEKEALCISIAAARPLADLEAGLGSRPLVRVMPNINAKVGAATCAFCCSEKVTEEQKAAVRDMFATIGSIDELAEEFFAIFSAVAGAAPAFAYIYIDSLARAATKAGLPRPQALKFAAQTAMGSAKLVLESGEHPWALVDQVCSPGGTTIEGVSALQNNRFEATLTAALDAVIEKDRRLQG